ncbi:hypothetical protein LAZ67_13001600 [Cordylochernes scorpioides]|uniref:Reverse transcriptase n=1 Tax=Cordylochernes scorpioides TaxID=51811 RepID=A0ABY6L3Z7_9ARAC|nr:hypothetical protein LAZ67_13001600 [Cordylochernes scorpioides]
METRSGNVYNTKKEETKVDDPAKLQLGATIGRDAGFEPVALNPNIEIPKYDGTDDPRPWIESLEEIGFLYHWADYIIARYAAMNMTGSAKTWLNLHKASFTSWENIKIRLIQDFSLDANKEELRMKLSRMQHWNEPAIRFAQDILVLCNKVDPTMEEETKIEHVIGGLKKEYSFALYLNPPKTTDELLVVCKKMDFFEKKYRERVEKSRNLYNGPRNSRPQQQSRNVPPTATRNYQTTSRPQVPVYNNYKNDSPPTPRQYRNNFPQPSTPRRPYNPNFVPKPNLQRNTYNKSQEVNKNRTEDGRPICFKCNKPGHVARYCRVKFIRILEEDPTATQEKVEEKCQMNGISDKSGPRLYADVCHSPQTNIPTRNRYSVKSTINGIKKLDPKYKLKINVDKIGTFEALVDTGADLSVVDLRTALDTGHENERENCKQETIKYDLTNNHDESNFEMLKIKSAKDSIVPECSIKLIKALVETEDGEYIIEESSKMFQTNGLRLARSLINVINRETHIWITNPYPRPLKIMKNQTLAFGSSPAKINVSREREVEENEEPRFQVSENLSPKEQKELKQVLERYGDLFSSRLGRTNLAKHRIDTEDAKPIKHKPYRKRDGKYRFCVDYRKLNNVTVKDVYPIPRIDEVMDTLQGSTYFSAIDLRSGYWQVKVEERDKEKTAFTTAHGLYEFNVMPFGLCNAPATFERNMENMLGNLRWQICLCYLDDDIIYSPDFPTHLKRLEAVFRCFRESNLRLNDKKCRFAFEELEILGYITSKHGIKPAEHNIKAVRNFPRPKKVKEVQSFLGMERQEEAFQTLKTALLSPPILGHFNPNAPTYVHTDASNIGIGATLVQDIGGEEKVISYLSRTLSKAEQNYSTTGKECLAVVWSMSKLRPYLYGRHFKIVTDHHALCWLKNLKDPTGRLARWALKIQEYDFDIIHKSGKKHLDADGLSRGPLPETNWDVDFERLFLNQITDEEDKFIESVKKNLNGSRRSIAQNFKVEDGCLFKKNPNPEGRAWLLVVTEKKKREIMKEYHNHMSNGHLGFARTMYRIKSKYFWPSMLKDVSEFVKTCHLCQSRKGSNQLPSGLLQPIPPANFPFERIGIDFVGPLPSTKNRKKWIIVLTDYYTRYAETKAVSEATVKEVSKFLVEDIFLRHGAPQYLISDRGSQFTSNLMEEVMKMCKIKHCFTTSYHPQTNGLTEQLNRTLINMLSMYVNTDQKNWDEILPFITHAYNTTIQETTGYSPFFLMFGREPTSLLDDRNISVDIDKDDYEYLGAWANSQGKQSCMLPGAWHWYLYKKPQKPNDDTESNGESSPPCNQPKAVANNNYSSACIHDILVFTALMNRTKNSTHAGSSVARSNKGRLSCLGRGQDKEKKLQSPTQKDLKILQLNVEGFTRAKGEIIEKMMREHKADVIALQETHTPENSKSAIRIPGYVIICSKPHPKFGLAIYITYKLREETKVLPETSHSIGIQINDLSIYNVYKPPSQLWIPTSLPSPQHPAIVLGDFNSHHTLWGYSSTDNEGESLNDWMEINDMQLIFDAKKQGTFQSARWGKTYSPDLCFVTKDQCDNPIQIAHKILTKFPKSQHCPSIYEMGIQIPQIDSAPIPRWNLGKANWEAFTKYIEDNINLIPPTPKNYSRASNLIISCAKKFIPRGHRKIYIPCWSPESERLYQEYNLSGNTETAENLIRSLDDSRKHRWHTMLEQMDFSKSSRKSWSLLRKLGGADPPHKHNQLTNPNKIATCISSKSRIHPNPSEKSRLKKAIGTNLSKSSTHPQLSTNIDLNEVEDAIKVTHNNRAPGPDGIMPEFMKHLGQKAIKWMAKLFTNILSTGSIPSVWKQAKVLAILKPGKTSDDPNNYRPISLLCIPYKILERIILNRISPIIEEYLPIEQAGFRPGRNCAEQTLALTTTIEDGFQKKIKNWSSFCGPNRRIRYTTNSQKFLYADDIALLHQEQSFSTLEQILNEDLKKLENFFSKWHLIPNPSKTVSSVFHLNNHKANRPLKLTFCNKPLSHDPCPKYLGVTLDRSLTFRQHLEKTRDKLKTRNNIMTRLAGTTWGCSADTLRTTALALVYSVAEYCAPVWERSSHTDSIDAQLNQTMRLITGNMRPTPIDWLPYLSNIAPPDLRRKKSTSNLLSKIKANTKLPINTVLEIPPPTRLISRNPVWVADENVDLKEEWRNRWSNLAIANKDLVEDPNTKPPGYNLPRRTWSTLNRIRTSTGRCNYLLNKWNMSPDQNCDCGQIQTMHHILRDCPRRFFQGTLGDIHRCTEEALEWIRHLDIPL